MTVGPLSESTTRIEWVRLTSAFLASQGAVQIITLLVGLLLLRILPIDQYALYTVAGALLSLLAIGANPGVSQFVITHGARVKDNNRQALGGLTDAALRQCRLLYVLMLPILLGISVAMLAPHDWSIASKAIAVVVVAATGWMRIPVMIATAVFNIHHDYQGLFQVGFVDAVMRLALIPLCIAWPHAGFALCAGLAGATFARWTGQRRLASLVDTSISSMPVQRSAILAFIVPLAPIIIYTMFQGQLAVLILSLFGTTASVAEFGAISRLNQIIALGMLLNPFLVQPIMARQHNRASFLNRVGLIVAGLAVVSTFMMFSAYLVPEWWLFLLGRTYSGLERELPVALAIGVLTLVGGTLYTVVISRNRTADQYWSILPSIGAQVIFIAFHGVTDVFDALLFSVFPPLVYALVQIVLLIRVARQWRHEI